MMDFLKKSVGGNGGEAKSEVDKLQCIRGLNRDWIELKCDEKKGSIPCANIIEAMKRLSLPAAGSPNTPEPVVDLGPARVASKPPTLVLQSDADAQATCTKRCGIFGAVLGAALSSTVLASNLVNDIGVAEQQRELVAQAGAASTSVVSVALCARLCEPGRKQKTFEAPGIGYKLKGEYTHTVQTKEAVEDFERFVAAKAEK